MAIAKRPAIIEDDIAKIPLGTSGKFAIVDKDFAHLDKYFWSLHIMGYAASRSPGKHTLLHRMIMQPEASVDIDHINGDKLDNRKSNLRLCSRGQNGLNKPQRSHSKQLYKGIEYRKDVGKYTARINFKGKRYNLGHYVTPEEAASVYNAKAKELFGEFAYLNEVPQS